MHVVFDLDGTLTDSSPGIIRCFESALERLGFKARPLISAECIGPPLPSVFEGLLGSNEPALIDTAIALYRERFESTGMFENALYPGVCDSLQCLQQDGHRLSVVTSKPHRYAVQILRHFGLAPLFTSVHGPSLDDRTHNKVTLLHDALAATVERRAVMVGDRAEDVHAARANGIPAMAVTWGYGSAAEISQAAPDYVANQHG